MDFKNQEGKTVCLGQGIGRVEGLERVKMR